MRAEKIKLVMVEIRKDQPNSLDSNRVACGIMDLHPMIFVKTFRVYIILQVAERKFPNCIDVIKSDKWCVLGE